MESVAKRHIRIISPSGTISPEYIDGAIERLRSWGYVVDEGTHARGECGRFSGTDAERLGDLTGALTNPNVDIVLCSRGGYGLQRIISSINIQPSALIPPTIVGFSDITALHQWSALAGRVSLHALMCKHIATLPEESEALQCFRRALKGEALSYNLPLHALNRGGMAQGTMIGGNLSVLYGLQGTPFSLNAVIDAHPEGVILFIEDVCERHYHIDRMMQNLRMSGVLERIKGLVVGQFTDCEDDPLMGCSVYETIRAAVEAYSYPVLFDFPAGHVEDNRPLWIGKRTILDTHNEVGILEQEA